MDDSEIVKRIGDLADREHQLERSHADDGLSEEDTQQLREIEEALDQCWDLLRQRRARRNAGQDPDDATLRPPSTVEDYKQ